MNNTFRITISAVDKATAVVRSVKNSFAQVTRPFSDLKSVVASLGKETGLDRVGKSILSITDATSSLASKMAGVFPALTGGLGIAAVATLAGHWGNLGAEIAKTSRILDISTDQFQIFEAVARRADVAPEALTGGLKNLASTMEDVFFHRASPEAITALRQMHIEFQRTATGAPDLSRAIDDIADATKRLQGNAQAQRKFLESLGLSQDLLPILSQGAAGMHEFADEFRRTHGMISADDIRRAGTFKDSMINLGDALAGVGTRLIANAGSLTEFNNAMANWIGGSGPFPLRGAGHYLGTAASFLGNPFAALAANAAGPLAATTVFPARHRSLTDDVDAINSWWKGNTPLPQITHYSDNPSQPQTSDNKGQIPPPPRADSIFIDAPAPPEINGRAPSVNAVTDAAAGTAPKMSIELVMKNAPAGMRARASLNDGSQIPVRVETSMPTTTMP